MQTGQSQFMVSNEVVLRVRCAAHILVFLAVLAYAGVSSRATAANLTLAWDPSTDPMVAGYNLYFGSESGNYTNVVDAGLTTSVTLSNLLPGTTYYFAATSYNLLGLESVYSAEAAYTVPGNVAPTLNPISDVTVDENSGPIVVDLAGITSGSSNEIQTLTVSAFSSNLGLVPNPTVAYLSPAGTGTLTFAPNPNSFGVAVITVMVDDGGATSNTIIRTFGLTVNPVVAPPPLTNALIAPNSYFKFLVNPPFTNHDKILYSLAPGAPAGAGVVTNKKGVSSLVWVPNSSEASSTNLITIVITDTSNPSLSTNQTVLVIVEDYLGVAVGLTSVQSGQNASVPIYLVCSDSLTNVSFSIEWPNNRFRNPSLAIVAPGVGSSTLVNQNTNLVFTIQTATGHVFQGSNFLAQLTFQTISNQSSDFVRLPVTIANGGKSWGASYLNAYPQAGRVTVVNDVPLLEATGASGAFLALNLYGKVGASYQLQNAPPWASPLSWHGVLTYNQTNLLQTLNLNAVGPGMIYRLSQQ